MTLIGLFLLLAGAAPADPAQSTQPPAPRAAFDFLVGDWTPQAEGGKATNSYYHFRKPAETPVIEGDWQFDRGVAGKPDFARGKYYSGYDNATATWSFYYVSDRSAQAWPGTLRDGIWYFEHDFVIDGKPVHQRQYWEPVDPRTVRRHIENQGPDGTYKPVVVVTLVRDGG